MREVYQEYGIKDGDELVLQVYGNDKYQILPEALFQQKIKDLELDLDQAPSQLEADAAITGIVALTNASPEDVLGSEYVRLSSQQLAERRVRARTDVKAKERIPPSLRRILIGLYKGRCQVSGFSFLKKDGEPYFEVHHINPSKGNHVKNVLVVSPNVHAQFTYAALEQSFDDRGWLRQVKFNGEAHSVFQVVDRLPAVFTKEVHSV